MKVALPTSNGDTKRKLHILPLVPDEDADALTKANSLTFDVPTITGSNDSPKYKMSIRVLQGTETARQVVQWKTSVATLIQGLNITQFSQAMTILRQTVKGNARNNLDAAAIAFCEAKKVKGLTRAQRSGKDATERAANVKAANDKSLDTYGQENFNDALLGTVQGVVLNSLPSKALARAKRQLRRFTRKPADMEVRTYVQHLERINAMEIPHLPPFGADQHLSDDELIDILMYGTPNRWEAEMDKQGFDPYAQNHTLCEVAEFMERIENAEEFSGTATTAQPKKGNKSPSNNKKRPNTGNDSSKAKKHCAVHGQCNHTTDECTVVKGLVSGKDSNKKSYQNKSWKRNADASTSASKKDLAVLIKKAVKTATKDIAAIEAKKRKSSGNSSDKELDLNAMNLDEFNYTDKDIDVSDLLEDGEIPLSGKSADC